MTDSDPPNFLTTVEEFSTDVKYTSYDGDTVLIHSLNGEGGRAVIGVLSNDSRFSSTPWHLAVGVEAQEDCKTKQSASNFGADKQEVKMKIDIKAEELASGLGIDKQEAKADLEALLEYDVPLDQAAQSVRRKHGGSSGGSSTLETLPIDEITTEHGSVNVTVRVLTQGTRTIRYQGEDQTIREGKLADESGTISYTAWQDFGFEAGASLVIGNAGVREWDGHPELNLGQSTTVSMADETVEVDQPVGGESDLIDLVPGDRGRNIEVKVQEVESRTIDGRDGETTILSGVLADETARLPFTDWNQHPDIEQGASLRIEDVYVRVYRGSPSVNLSEFSTIRPLPEQMSVIDSGPLLSIGEAVDNGGLFDIEIVGKVIEVRDGSGLIKRCPECDQVIQNSQCPTHGEVVSEFDLRIRAIINDGTGSVTAIFGTKLAEEIYGGDLEDAKQAALDALNTEVVVECIREELVGGTYRLRGSLLVDERGTNLNVEHVTEMEDLIDDTTDTASAFEYDSLINQLSIQQQRCIGIHEKIQEVNSPQTILASPQLSLKYNDIEKGDPIGSGGNADVYRAIVARESGEVELALKEPRISGTIDTSTVDRILTEAETWQQLDDHDHIVSVVDYGSNPLPWIAMEYIDGGDLSEHIGDIEFEQALWTALAITKGVRHAHKRGVVHLDLKPENVLLQSVDDAWDVPKIADWGLSKQLLEHSKTVDGMSLHYAAPEQFDTDTYGPTDNVTDVYQLGAVFYELFTGRPPYDGQTFEVINKIRHKKPTPPSHLANIPTKIDDILLTALATDKDNRYEDVIYIRDELQNLCRVLM